LKFTAFKTRPRKNYAVIFILLLAGLILSAAAFRAVNHWDHQRFRAAFERASENRYSALRREIDSTLQALQALNSFYLHSDSVTRPEFRGFTEAILSRHHHIQAFEWIPRVPREMRQKYEAEAKKDGFPGFTFTRQAAQGEMVQIGPRDEYFPAYFVEPYKGNEASLGFDLASDLKRKKALEKARDSAEMTATGRVILVQEKGDQYGFLVFSPVYGKDLSAGPERNRRLMGFVSGVFRIGDMIEESVAYLTSESIDQYIYDQSAPEAESFLYFHPGRPSAVTKRASHGAAHQSEGLEYSKTIDVAGRKWLITYKATPFYMAKNKPLEAWGILFGGLFITFMLTAFLFVNIRRAEALSETNARLLTEISEREHSEKRIHKLLSDISRGKEEWEKTFDSASELIALVDEKQRIIRCNKSFADFVGLSVGDLPGRYCYDFLPYDPDRMDPGYSGGTEKTSGLYEVKTASGAWLYLSFRPIPYGEGNAQSSIITATDITVLKIAQQRLLQSEEELLKRVRDLEKFYNMAIDRELRMKDLKLEIKKLRSELSLLGGDKG